MTDADTTQAGVTAAALDGGRALDIWSLALTLVALAALAWTPGASGWRFGGLAACVAAGMAQRYYAARVAFDAGLFRRWAAGRDAATAPENPAEALAATDRALVALGLRKCNGEPTRDLADRSRGALRLFGRQALCLFLQFAAVLAAIAA